MDIRVYNDAGVRIVEGGMQHKEQLVHPWDPWVGSSFSLGGAVSVISQTHHHTSTMFKVVQSLFTNLYLGDDGTVLASVQWSLERY